MPGDVNILIVLGEPDRRESTRLLRRSVMALDRRAGVTVTTWFLRAYSPPEEEWPRQWVVDRLRTWWLAALLSRMGLERAAGKVRGLRLRWCLRRVGPSVVLLDDGIGERLLPSIPGSPVVVKRFNPEPPPGRLREATPSTEADVVLEPGQPPGALPAFATPQLLEAEALHEAASRSRFQLRERLGVEGEIPLVVGWGSDGWLDGPDLFIRALWFLEDRHGIRAHGLWLYDDDNGPNADELADEARRCGLADRFNLHRQSHPDERCCADAAFLPFRDMAGYGELLETVAHGVPVVSFAQNQALTPWLHLVEPLDLEGAAAELAAVIEADSEAVSEDFLDHHDLGRSCDRFLALVAEAAATEGPRR